MVKKLKSFATESNLSSTIRDSAQQIWLAGLGAFAKAQQEGNKVFDALVREGESIQAKTLRVAEGKVTEMAAKATGSWDKLEQVFENRVAKALNGLGVPSKDDIESLTARVASLTAEVEKLNAAAKATPKASKPASKASAAKPEGSTTEAPAKSAPRTPTKPRKSAKPVVAPETPKSE